MTGAREGTEDSDSGKIQQTAEGGGVSDSEHQQQQ